MGISLQDYRLQIGMFIGTKFSKRSRTKSASPHKFRRTSSIKLTFLFLLVWLPTLHGIVNRAEKSVTKENLFGKSPTFKYPCQFYSSSWYKNEDNTHIGGQECGHGGKVNNFWARYVYGNRNRGIKLCHWNVGGGYLYNKIDTITNLIEEYTPHVLGISEASFRGDHRLEDVQISGYKLYLAKTLKNPQLNISRVAVYVHEDIIVNVRDDLMNEEFSSIWLELGLPRQKKFLVSHIYRDWQYVRQQNHDSLSIAEQIRRWDIFIQQ